MLLTSQRFLVVALKLNIECTKTNHETKTINCKKLVQTTDTVWYELENYFNCDAFIKSLLNPFINFVKKRILYILQLKTD